MALCTHFAHASHFSAFAVHAGHDKSTNHAPETVRVQHPHMFTAQSAGTVLYCFQGSLGRMFKVDDETIVCAEKHSCLVVSVGDQHSLLVTVSGGRTPSQTAAL